MVTVKAKSRKSKTPDHGLEVERVRLDSLTMYHRNPRRGNPEKTAESLRKNGQFKPIVVNRGTKTGRKREILAGNHTWLGAGRLGWEYINVQWVDVDDTRAKFIVLADNGTSDDSEYDNDVLSQLIEEAKQEAGSLVGTTYTDDALDKLLVEVNTDPLANVDRIDDASDDLPGVADFNNFRFFDSDADFDIPQLLPDMIPKEIPQPLDIWAGHELDLPRQQAEPERWWITQWHSGCRGVNWAQSIASFYTEDFQFEHVYTEPGTNTKKLLNLGIPMAIMPNFSVNETWPIYTWIWSVAKSFYVGRYFQEAGIEVIPDIQYGGTDDALNLALLGIPEGAPVVSTQIQNIRGDKDRMRTTARLLKQAEDRIGWDQILVYGHTDADRVLEYADLSSDIVRVANRTARRREFFDNSPTMRSWRGAKSKKEG